MFLCVKDVFQSQWPEYSLSLDEEEAYQLKRSQMTQPRGPVNEMSKKYVLMLDLALMTEV